MTESEALEHAQRFYLAQPQPEEAKVWVPEFQAFKHKSDPTTWVVSITFDHRDGWHLDTEVLVLVDDATGATKIADWGGL